MKILGIEFSSQQRSVAVVDGSSGPVRMLGNSAESGPRGLKGLALIDSVIKGAKLQPTEIDCIAVGLGPGSYTGIRAAISIAQGWQVGRNVKLLGLSSVEVLAAQAQRDGLRGRIAIVIDAQRNEFCLAVYEILAGKGRIVEPLHLATRAEVEGRREAGDLLVGPEVDRWFPGARVVFPEAGMLAELASGRNDYISGDKLSPIYLRETSFVKAPPRRTDL